jgi:N6-adenosine-specific RNA methylase IME4
MPTEEICALEIPCTDDSALFLWATSPLLPEAVRVMKAWGFEYRTTLVWDKVLMGIGFWLRGRHELLLIGTRGRFSLAPELCSEGVYSEKRTKHSRKPAFFRELIASLYPNESKLEMFAREVVPGWDVWGNEVNSLVQIPFEN